MSRNYKLRSITVGDISGESVKKLETNIRSSFENESVYNEAIERILETKLTTLNAISADKISITNPLNKEVVFNVESGASSFPNGLDVSGAFLTLNAGLKVEHGVTLLKDLTTDGNITITNGLLTTPDMSCTHATISGNINNVTKTTTRDLNVKKLGREDVAYINFDDGKIKISKEITPIDKELILVSGDYSLQIKDEEVIMGKTDNLLKMTNTTGGALIITNTQTTFSGNVYVTDRDIEIRDATTIPKISLKKDGGISCEALTVGGIAITNNGSSGGGGNSSGNSTDIATLSAELNGLIARINALDDDTDQGSLISRVKQLDDQTNIESLISKVTTLESTTDPTLINSAISTVNAVDSRVSSLETVSSNNTLNIFDLQSRVTTLEG
tara:strand:+ start:572 stop:1732 length:1161 start_codon:yes stop_codon:yes gene_type:complete